MKIRKSLMVGAFAILLASTCSNRAMAQSAAPMTARVTVTQVKPDMLNEWLDLEKNEVVPALKKGGQKTGTVYATLDIWQFVRVRGDRSI
jgi:ABC-type sugar transport system substrate-binding protein